MRHNPGGVFSGSSAEIAPWTPRERDQYYRNRDPYAYSYSKPKPPPPRQHKPHEPGNKCWCGYSIGKREIVSAALWCDAGDHAFSSNDEKRHRFSETKMEKDPDYGQREVTVTVDVCGPCWANNNPFRKDADATPIPQDESYLRGYRDGVVKGEAIS